MRLLCDEMLKGLSRWLRAAGHDAETAPAGTPDGTLLVRARDEARWFVSRDREIAEHRAAAGILVLLESDGLDACAVELGRRLALDWLAAPFSRCLECNRPLAGLPPDRRHRLPPERDEGRWCPACDRVYWAGGHVRRMRRRLARWQAASRSCY